MKNSSWWQRPTIVQWKHKIVNWWQTQNLGIRTFLPWTIASNEVLPRTIPPGLSHLGQLPLTNSHLGNCPWWNSPLGNYPPDLCSPDNYPYIISTRTTDPGHLSPMKFPPGHLPLWQLPCNNFSLDNCPSGNCPHEIFPRETSPPHLKQPVFCIADVFITLKQCINMLSKCSRHLHIQSININKNTSWCSSGVCCC